MLFNINKDLSSSKKNAVDAAIKVIKPKELEIKASRPITSKITVNAKLGTKNSKKGSHVSFDNFTKDSASDFKTYRQSADVINDCALLDDFPAINHVEQNNAVEKNEQFTIKNEVMDIANMLESLQLQTPCKAQIKPEVPKSVNIQTAGDGVCISTDGTCLTVLTPVRASRKVEKGNW